MKFESIREKLAKIGELPGLSEWQRKTVLLFRCRDIDKDEFVRRVQSLARKVAELLRESKSESMEDETYLAAQEYYDAARESLESFHSGLQCLQQWVELQDNFLLDQAKLHFAAGDRLAQEAVPLAFEAQESFRETDEEVMKSLGIDLEGID